MAYEFKFPDVGEGIHEGKIVKWLVKEGDEIKMDDSIAEVETDKAVVEIPSPKSGKIMKISHTEGETIKVGEILATIDAGSSGEEDAAAQEENAGVVGDLGKTAAGVLKAPDLNQSGAVFGGDEPKETTVEKPVESVSTKKEEESEPEKKGTVNVVSAGFKAVKKYDMFGYVDRAPYDGVRKAIGNHMVKSMFTIPHVTHTDIANVSELWDLRKKEKKTAEKMQKRAQSASVQQGEDLGLVGPKSGAAASLGKKGFKLTFLPYFIKAVVEGLKKHPYLNSSLDEEEGQIILKKYFNIGIAVDTEAGLMVPVIKGADQKSIFDLAKEITELAEKARTRKLNPMDMKGATFTITNIGSAGSGIFATPVINHPEAAILGTGMIEDGAVVVNGEVQVGKVLPLSLSFDHRIIDGAEGARFTKTVKELLENPKGLAK